jgi:hypothetical protein
MHLPELVDRSLRRRNPFEGMPELIEAARAKFPEFQRSLTAIVPKDLDWPA